MTRLGVFSGRDVCRILVHNGFVKIRQKGSHIIMQKKRGGSTITVPVPDHSEIRTGTLLGIIRQAELPRSLFEIE
jgi:predicted RNA binding protein YcfA (HicA-like mRNA interferase family)